MSSVTWFLIGLWFGEFITMGFVIAGLMGRADDEEDVFDK